MRKEIIFIFFIAIVFSACQQSSKPSYEALRSTYQKALDYSDFGVATNATYDMLVNYPEEKSWRDTLALLYFSRKAFGQAILVSEEILKDRPDDNRMLAIVSNAYRAVGDEKSALDKFENLYKSSGDIYHLYEIANVQYSLKRVNECLTTANTLLQNPDIANKSVELLFNKQKQVVPMEAAVLNLKGVLAKDTGKNEEAKVLFEKALASFPDFLLAQGNLEAL